MDEVECGTPEDAITRPAGREAALSYPAAVLGLLVGLEGQRLREVASALATSRSRCPSSPTSSPSTAAG